MPSCSVKVVCRFRPYNEREKTEDAAIKNKSKDGFAFDFDESNLSVRVIQPTRAPETFTLDRIFHGDDVKQKEVFDLTAAETVRDVIQGYNGTIFAYGQTGAGKTHTMFGPDITQDHLKGIIPRACEQIFRHIQQDNSGTEYQVKCSFLEIYREIIRDLLDPKKNNLKVRETPTRGVWVDGLTEEYVTNTAEVIELLKTGERFRATSFTQMNAASSRSHSLFVIQLIQKSLDGSTKTGKLNLADLAGSEKVGKTGASGDTLEEAKKINQSLSALGNCIHALTKKGKLHIPYRDSKLTFVLRESLGGNAKTTLIVACSPAQFNADETISTLRFASRAKTIKNKVTVNQHRSTEELMAIIKKLKIEIVRMRKYSSYLEGRLALLDDSFDAEEAKKHSHHHAEKSTPKESISSPTLVLPAPPGTTNGAGAPPPDHHAPSPPSASLEPQHKSLAKSPNSSPSEKSAPSSPRASPLPRGRSRSRPSRGEVLDSDAESEMDEDELDEAEEAAQLSLELEKLKEKFVFETDQLKEAVGNSKEAQEKAEFLLNETKSSLNRKEKELADTVHELEIATSNNAQQRTHLESELHKAQVELETATQLEAQTRASNESLQARLSRVQDTNQQEVNRLQEAISLANQQISKAEEVLQAEKARVAEIEERFAEQRLQLAREERENTDLQSVLASVKADKKRLTEECQQLSYFREEALKRDATQKRQIERITQKLEQANEKCKSLSEDLEQRVSELADREKLEAAGREASSLSDALRNEMSSLKARLKEEEQTRGKIVEELDTTKDDLVDASAEVQSLQLKLSEKEKELEELNEVIVNLKNDIQQLKAEKAEREDGFTALLQKQATQLRSLEEDKCAFVEEKNYMQKQIEELMSRSLDLAQKSSSSLDESDQLRDRFAKMEAELKGLQKLLDLERTRAEELAQANESNAEKTMKILNEKNDISQTLQEQRAHWEKEKDTYERRIRAFDEAEEYSAQKAITRVKVVRPVQQRRSVAMLFKRRNKEREMLTARHSFGEFSLIKEGYLSKQGGFIRNWKKRFFRLKEEKPAPRLYYFSDEKQKEPLGAINLEGVAVQAAEQAKSQQEMEEWIEKINQIVKETEEEIDTLFPESPRSPRGGPDGTPTKPRRGTKSPRPK